MRLFFTLGTRIIFLALILLMNSCSEDNPSAPPAIDSIEPSAGSAGRQVVITGSGFATSRQGNTVKFNGTSAEVVSATADELVVTAPSATTGEVTVETKHGTSNGPVFTYQSVANSITSFQVGDYNVSMGSNTITLSIPALTDVTQLAPVITVSDLATVSPASGTVRDFTGSVQYTVTAEDNSTRVYTVNIQWVYGITALTLNSGTSSFAVMLDHENFLAKSDLSFFNVRLRESSGTPLTFSATLAPGFLLTPPSGGTIDLDDTGSLFAKAPNAVVQSYTWQIRNKDAFITGLIFSPTAFSFQAHQAYPEDAAGLDDTDLIVRILTSEPYQNVVPSNIHYSEHATLVPSASTAVNFTDDVVYQVTSETGVINSYKVRVLREKVLITNDYPGTYSSIPANGNPFWTVYRSVSEITGAKLIHSTNGSEINCTVSTLVSDGQKYLYVYPAGAFPAGDYRLRVQLADGSVVLIRCIHRAS